jgi:D-3-phosphoglycerate dehydrogenase
VVVLDDWEGLWADADLTRRLYEVAKVTVYQEPLTGERLCAATSGAAVLVLTRQRTALSGQDLDEMPNLQLVCNTGTGVSHLDTAALAERGIALRTTPGLAVDATAEHTMSLALAVAHRLVPADAAVRRGMLEPAPVPGLAGRRIGVCGVGAVGREVLRHAHGFGMQLAAWSPGGPREVPVGPVRWADSPEELARDVDIFSIHLRAEPGAPPLVDAGVVDALPDGAIVLNTARAAVVDEAVLARRIRRGQIAVGADVFGETLRLAVAASRGPSVLTPHVGWMSEAAMARMTEAAARKVVTFLEQAGKPAERPGDQRSEGEEVACDR